jgi:hypothetical protein
MAKGVSPVEWRRGRYFRPCIRADAKCEKYELHRGMVGVLGLRGGCQVNAVLVARGKS